MTYEHYNQAYDTASWGLYGGLVLNNGTVITSDTVTKTIGYSTKTLYTNTFNNLPTASQFSSITYVRTYDSNGSYEGTGISEGLTWRADSSYPMRIIVTYYDEEPLVYRPTIEKFEVARGVGGSSLYSTGTRDDNGTDALFTIKLSAVNRSTALDSAAKVYLYYSSGAVNTSSSRVSMSYYFDNLISGITDAEISTNIIVSGDEDYNFLLTFEYNGETTSARTSLDNTFVSLHISGCRTGGVSIGDISTSTEGNPKFEVHHPTYLYGGIAQIGGSSSDVLKALGIQAGAVAPASINYSTIKSGTVTFDAQFSSIPTISTVMTTDTDATGIENYWAGEVNMYVHNVTTNGFDYIIINGRSENKVIGFNWTAVGSSGGITSGGSSSDGSGSDSGDDESGSGTGTTTGAVAINGLTFSNGILSYTNTDGTGGSVTIFRSGTSLPTTGNKTGDLFFKI